MTPAWSIVRRASRRTARRLLNTIDPSYAVARNGRRSAAQLAGLHGAYAGRRCFIIGNGPSLNAMDLRPLAGELTFGLNRGYLLFDRIGAPTTFLVSVNRFVIEQSATEMLAAPSIRFFSWHARRFVPRHEDVIYLKNANGPRFSTDLPRSGVWEGATVTYVALQIAYWLGCTEAILIGVDHSFATKGEAHRLVTSERTDPNHFDPHYFGPGYRWQLPDLATSELAYRLARSSYEAAGRLILDATVSGKLEVFPKVDYRSLFVRPSP